jgi:hypothetical protein
MKDLAEYLIKSLVSKPEKVRVSRETEGEIINFKVKVDEEDMGMIIGRQGKIIKSIRALIRTRALVEKKKVQLSLDEAKK